jgi:threonyl-tRNA synthetase
MAKFPIETIRHSAAHVMAAAVQKLFGDVKFDIGPSTNDGFYYDFDMEHRLSVEDLEKIEEEMRKIVNAHLPFEYSEMSREEAKAMLEGKISPINLNVWLILKKVPRSPFTPSVISPTSAAVLTLNIPVRSARSNL